MITSYQDIKTNKILNKWILSAIAYALATNIVLIAIFATKGTLNVGYIYDYLINSLFAIISGYLIWDFKLWTAGDGKLYIAFAFLIPLTAYSDNYIEMMPSVVILLNTFIVSAAVLLATVITKIHLKTLLKSLSRFKNEAIDPKKFFESALRIISLSWIIKLILAALGLKLNFIINMFILFFFMDLVQKYLEKSTTYLFGGLVILRLLIDPEIYSLPSLKGAFIIILIWRILRSFLNTIAADIAFEHFTRKVKVKELKEGMILAECIAVRDKISKEDKERIKKDPRINVSRHKDSYYIRGPIGYEKSPAIKNNPEGLDSEQIRRIKTFGLVDVRISQTIPFAPILFIGVIITIALKGNLLILL